METTTANVRATRLSPASLAEMNTGEKAAVQLTAETKIAFVAFPGANAEVYTINADGSASVNLTNNPAADFSPSWSPGMSKLAFESDRSGSYQIYTMNANGTAVTRLTYSTGADTDPAWSPDGRRIAFVRGGDIWLINADRSGEIQITHDPTDDGDPSWSPDGTKIVFTASRDGNREIYIMDADGSPQLNLTQNPAQDYLPKWSPDGTLIAFISERDGNREIYSIKPDRTQPTNLTRTTSGELWPTWSPDGTKIAFTSFRTWPAPLYIMDADGNNQTPLTTPSSNNYEPAWSPFGIPDFKQDTGTWSSTPIADHNCDALSNIGCAVTSIADVLAYYGVSINGVSADPGNVNQWLGNHTGFDDCNVRWDQLSLLTNSTVPNLSSGRAWNERQTAISNALAANELPIISVYPGTQINDNQHLHYVVVTGNAGTDTNPDYIINDPLSNAWSSGNQSGKALSQTIYGTVPSLLSRHYLQTVVIHRPGGGLPPRLSMYSRSPIQVLITDPSGLQTGYNPTTGTYMENIPGSTYDLEGGITNGVGSPTPNTLYFHLDNPADGAYKVQIIGIGTGPYTLSFVGTNQSGAITTGSQNGTTSVGQVQTTQVTYSLNNGVAFQLFMPLIKK